MSKVCLGLPNLNIDHEGCNLLWICKSRKCQPEETYEEVVAPIAAKPMKEVAPSHNDEIPEEHDMLELQEPPHMNISHKIKPTWAREIIQEA